MLLDIFPALQYFRAEKLPELYPEGEEVPHFKHNLPNIVMLLEPNGPFHKLYLSSIFPPE